MRKPSSRPSFAAVLAFAAVASASAACGSSISDPDNTKPADAASFSPNIDVDVPPAEVTVQVDETRNAAQAACDRTFDFCKSRILAGIPSCNTRKQRAVDARCLTEKSGCVRVITDEQNVCSEEWRVCNDGEQDQNEERAATCRETEVRSRNACETTRATENNVCAQEAADEIRLCRDAKEAAALVCKEPAQQVLANCNVDAESSRIECAFQAGENRTSCYQDCTGDDCNPRCERAHEFDIQTCNGISNAAFAQCSNTFNASATVCDQQAQATFGDCEITNPDCFLGAGLRADICNTRAYSTSIQCVNDTYRGDSSDECVDCNEGVQEAVDACDSRYQTCLADGFETVAGECDVEANTGFETCVTQVDECEAAITTDNPDGGSTR